MGWVKCQAVRMGVSLLLIMVVAGVASAEPNKSDSRPKKSHTRKARAAVQSAPTPQPAQVFVPVYSQGSAPVVIGQVATPGCAVPAVQCQVPQGPGGVATPIIAYYFVPASTGAYAQYAQPVMPIQPPVGQPQLYMIGPSGQLQAVANPAFVNGLPVQGGQLVPVPANCVPAGPPTPEAVDDLKRCVDDCPRTGKSETSLGYQGTVLTLPTLGLGAGSVPDNISLNGLSYRAWGSRRFGGEVNLSFSDVAAEDLKKNTRSSFATGGIFGKLLYLLAERGASRFYTGVQLGLPLLQVPSVDLLSFGALIGSEFSLWGDNSVRLNLDVGLQHLGVKVTDRDFDLTSIFVSGGVHYYF